MIDWNVYNDHDRFTIEGEQGEFTRADLEKLVVFDAYVNLAKHPSYAEAKIASRIKYGFIAEKVSEGS